MSVDVGLLIELAGLATEALTDKDFRPVFRLAQKLAALIDKDGVGAIPKSAADSLYAAIEAYEKSVFEKLEKAGEK